MLRTLAFLAALFLLALPGAALLLAAPTRADEQSEFISKALTELQSQRNTALDDAVNARARAAILGDQLAAARQRIAELEKRAENKEAPK